MPTASLVATALIAGVLLVDHGAIAAPLEASAQTQALPVPTGDAAFRDDATHASVVFAGGCFWGVQGVFQQRQQAVIGTPDRALAQAEMMLKQGLLQGFLQRFTRGDGMNEHGWLSGG